MAENALVKEVLQLLQTQFEVAQGTEGIQSIPPNQSAREYLITLLSPEIRRLCDHSFEQLLHILYRVDIPEPRVVELLEQSDPEDMVYNLTAAIVDRQLEKIKLREKYRNFGD